MQSINQSSNLSLDELKSSILEDLESRVQDKILEEANYNLLFKLINNAENKEEAIAIAELGTTYKRTGFHFDKKLEKISSSIKYFKKNTSLSFCQNDSLNTHKLIIGDNYSALLNLSISYKGKIDIIYIDPPYGKDDMGEFADTNYNNAITRDNLLSMLYPRLVLAKQLLSDEGVIFCSIDDKNQAYVKCLFDEVFEEKHFILNTFFRKTKTSTGDDKSGLNIQHDYILAYFNKNLIQLKGAEKNYKAYKNPDNDPNGDWTSGDPSAKSGGRSSYFEITNPYTNRIDLPPKGRYWAFSKGTLEKYIEQGRIVFKKDYPLNERGFIFKRYKSSLKSEFNPLDSLYFANNSFLNENGKEELKNINLDSNFDYPKPTALIKQLISTLIKKDLVILDFFAGSGTTGQAVLELNKEDGGNRTFILCTNNEKKADVNPNGIAYDVTSKRLKRVMTGSCYDGTKDFEWIKKNSSLGDNLDVYEIAEVSNTEQSEGKSAFDVIDETLYGEVKMTPKDKIKWVCENFSVTQKYLEDRS